MAWLERSELILGKENIEKLKQSKILVCGLGGVGGAAAEQLVRAGVGNLCIIDADIISETNINRQIIATQENIGKYKVEELKKRLLSINPKLNIDARKVYLRDEVLDNTIIEGWDYVVDAIDTLSPKLFLLKNCYKNNIPVVSSMGSGGKTDPSKIKVSDISESYNCGLARNLRKRLHRLGIFNGIKVVFSEEQSDKNAIIEEESTNKKSNSGTISYMPVIFGCFCAGVVIRSICGLE
ncbi:MAG: tRNA threonylcarbamoyladenosine dehydratase [Bacteroidales bacterium]|jgi:tRNA A37 threonylcarbamoyladenosine dehydratase|nr:tRNA threonylcarbamoyladenosine dehydratase [Bacteroidales bacterium]MCK9499518.1 tRNA threonylcarbamoyladenosine dehydratase [Bacteroidales bacterium]MDY0314836.1 tRNA threonylcarbamoyladenosine dehydratase [Bacteroidales bacterium]NLB86288.1 tRNA threonylcarbamoyladenosine dehydratase [Bacteroidales bacterium]